MVITVKNLCKSYKEDKILKDINITFEKGKIYGLVGRNGSGKTVLMKCICGLTKITSGEVKIDDKVLGVDIDIPENISIIIESPGFIPNYSGYKNLKYLAMINNRISNEDIKNAIKRVGLDPDSKKHVSKYSLGMKQRLGIAQAIMEDPELLILDEPMNGLDKNGVEDVRKILLDLKKQGKTVIIATHIMEDVELLCEHVYRMDAGVLTKQS